MRLGHETGLSIWMMSWYGHRHTHSQRPAFWTVRSCFGQPYADKPLAQIAQQLSRVQNSQHTHTLCKCCYYSKTPASKVATLPEPTDDQSSVTVQKEKKNKKITQHSHLHVYSPTKSYKIIQDPIRKQSTHISVQDSGSTQNAVYTSQRSIIHLNLLWE